MKQAVIALATIGGIYSNSLRPAPLGELTGQRAISTEYLAIPSIVFTVVQVLPVLLLKPSDQPTCLESPRFRPSRSTKATFSTCPA